MSKLFWRLSKHPSCRYAPVPISTIVQNSARSSTRKWCRASLTRCHNFTQGAHLRNSDNGGEALSIDNAPRIRFIENARDIQPTNSSTKIFPNHYGSSTDGKSLHECCAELLPKLTRKRVVGPYRGAPSLLISHENVELTRKPSIDQDLALWIDTLLTSPRQSNSAKHISIELLDDIFLHKTSQSTQSMCIEVEFRRISKGNALSSKLIGNLTRVFKAIAKSGKIDAVVLTGGTAPDKSPVFCGGADVGDLQDIMSVNDASAFIGRISRLCTEIRKLQAPVVAAIDGPCIGAGLEVAASCDIRVATMTSSFSMPEVLLGIPSVVEARLLCDIVGWGRARHLMLTGCTWNADQALQSGLITQMFEDRTGMDLWVRDFGVQCNAKIGVHKAQKALMRDWEHSTIEGGIKAGKNAFAARFTEDLGPEVRNEIRTVVANRKRKQSTKGIDVANKGTHNQLATSHTAEESSIESSTRDEQPQ